MNFSEQTFNALAAYEKYFTTAIDGNWCPNPGRAALTIIHDALDAHDGRVTRMNYNCATCQLNLVKRAGYMYRADKEERIAAMLAVKTPAKRQPTRTRKGATAIKAKKDE